MLLANPINKGFGTKCRYTTFGSPLPGRQFNSGNYRYGFNGKESDGEVKGSGNSYDYGMRIYDPRLGKFLSVDPLTTDYPELTPYQFASNTPIQAIDLDGLEQYHYTLTKNDGKTTLKFVSVENDWVDYNLQPEAVYVNYLGHDFQFINSPGPGEYGINQVGAFAANPTAVIEQNNKDYDQFVDNVLVGSAIGMLQQATNSNSPIMPKLRMNSSMKSQSNANNGVTSEGTKKVFIDPKKYPAAAKHIDDAQASGKPVGGVLNRSGATQNRKDALKGTKTESGKDRDEYPPAILSTGGKNSSVRLIGSSDNRGAGASMGNQLKGVPDGTNVEITTSPTYNNTPH